MKTVLILGGASVHVKLVEAAHRLGYKTIVVDYLNERKSPAKLVSDENYQIDISDIESIIKLCQEKKVDGVISTHLDPCQRYYQMICEELNLPCYGTKDQFFKMTDKNAFKKMCQENGVDTIEDYSIEDILNDNVHYPIFIKPVDSRGSRGQSVCNNKNEAIIALELAKKESSNGDLLIEKYMKEASEIQITYFYIDGKPYLIRTVDSYNGGEEYKLEKVVSCSISPSKYTNEYIQTTQEKVLSMFDRLGIKNGPVFMQGFYDNGKFRFFDPGLRFPGVDYDLVYPILYNEDLMELMIEFSIYGEFSKKTIDNEMVYLKGCRAAVLFPTIRKGTIREIKGLDKILHTEGVFSLTQRHIVNEIVEWSYNVNQRIAEVDILCDSTELLKRKIQQIQHILQVVDANGENMVYAPFDVERIDKYE